MAKITKIEVQQKQQHRYNIYIDDIFAFGISEETLLRFRLHKDMLIDDALIQQIVTDNTFQKVYLKAINYLSYALRTEYEVQQKLIANLNEDELLIQQSIIDNVIARLKQEKYINDDFYVQAFIQNALAVTGKGRHSITRDLLKKGVDQQLIAEHLSNIDTDVEEQTALKLAQKYADKQKNSATLHIIQKTKQHLIQKGYSFALADTVVSQLELDNNEADALLVQGDKLWRKYSKKHTGYELKQKMLQALYQKGFPSDDAKAYILQKLEEHE